MSDKLDSHDFSEPAEAKRSYFSSVIISVLFILITGLVFFIGTMWTKQSSDEASDTKELLFVIKGDARVIGDKITLTDDRIEWFTNRPDRDAGQMTPDSFIKAWREGDFDEVPPNAAFSNLDAVIELKNPIVSGNKISFTFKVVSGDIKDGNLPDAALFVDSYPTSVNDQITDIVSTSSASDGYCWYDQAPWQVVGIVKYIADTMTCDQRDDIMQQFLSQLALKDYNFSITVTTDYPQANTAWLCAGSVKPFNAVSPWQLENTNCDPIDATLKQSYGFEVNGQTSLSQNQ